MNVDYWPENLNSIDRRGGISITELWMLKEQMAAGTLTQVEAPEKAFGRDSRFYTMYATEGSDVYVIMTEGNPVDDPNWCFIRAVNKISAERASVLLSRWPYE